MSKYYNMLHYIMNILFITYQGYLIVYVMIAHNYIIRICECLNNYKPVIPNLYKNKNV